MQKLKPTGIYGLAYWDNGFKDMTANRPLHKPEDFRGLKMRIQSSKVLEAQMRALGALPQVMAFSEVYQAMQTGVVDGSENTPSNIYTQKVHEVQKHMTVSQHGYIGYAVIVNLKFWDSLPADVRGQLEQAMSEATEYANEIAQQDNDAALAGIKASGKTEIYLSDRRGEGGVAKGFTSRARKDGVAHRQGPGRGHSPGGGGRRLLTGCYFSASKSSSDTALTPRKVAYAPTAGTAVGTTSTVSQRRSWHARAEAVS